WAIAWSTEFTAGALPEDGAARIDALARALPAPGLRALLRPGAQPDEGGSTAGASSTRIRPK
ncbi:MAG: hypothetical protein RIS45_1763, partial [Planctomycetota bacterium]